jgi:hypothetical protein
MYDFGQCKLTGTHGKYVKPHIIPKALTETLWKGNPLMTTWKTHQAVGDLV